MENEALSQVIRGPFHESRLLNCYSNDDKSATNNCRVEQACSRWNQYDKAWHLARRLAGIRSNRTARLSPFNHSLFPSERESGAYLLAGAKGALQQSNELLVYSALKAVGRPECISLWGQHRTIWLGSVMRVEENERPRKWNLRHLINFYSFLNEALSVHSFYFVGAWP